MKLKYNNSSESKEFMATLKHRIACHIEENRGSQYANQNMWFKVFWILALWAGTYALILSNKIHGPWLFVLAMTHALTHLLIAFNISHDANHDALSRKPSVNKLFSYSLDLIGVSSYFWRIAHNQQHHTYINVLNWDDNVNGYGIMRFSPDDTQRKIHRFQHIYASLLYGLVTLNYVTIKDFKLVFKAIKYQKTITVGAIVELLASKIFYFSYVFVIPMYLLDLPFLNVLAAFLAGHFVVGLLLSYIFQCGHLTEDAHYPHVEDEHIQDAWAIHVVKSTCDYAANNKILTYLSGAINIHIAHHLFPTICHTHYKSLIPIIRQTAHEYHLKYREHDGVIDAVASHLYMLKELGRPSYDNTEYIGTVTSSRVA